MSVKDELLTKYMVRKTNEQKTAFIEYARERASALGYPCRVEGNGDKLRNIVIGDLEGARVVYTAHYDTPPVMPFPNFITPRNFLIYFVYQMAIVLLMLLVPVGIALALRYTVYAGVDSTAPLFVFLVLYYAELFLLLYGPANKNNANDNTSGVLTVFEIMERLSGTGMPVAFVLFDLEERGLVGSKDMAKRHKATLADKLIVNFDCVGDGDNVLFVARKGARADMPAFRDAYTADGGFTPDFAERGVFYPSDQNSFRRAVGVATFNRGPLGILYTSRIHTAKDTVLDEKNVIYLADGAVRLATAVCNNTDPVSN